MFLLERMKKNDRTNNSRVFVSYIRRYVLTNEFDNILVAFSGGKFSSPIFGDMFLLLFDQLVDISTIIDIFNGTLNGQ